LVKILKPTLTQLLTHTPAQLQVKTMENTGTYLKGLEQDKFWLKMKV
jgi:hypothetical protein